MDHRPDGGGSPRVVAHRGCAGQHPENTVAAVSAVAHAVDAVEVDVRRCGSGELVVFHDETLDRVTGATGRVANTDWDRLRELDVLGSGEPVPSLSAVLDAAPADTALNVELKGEGVAADAVECCRTADPGVLFSSFRNGELAAAADAGVDGDDLAYLFADDAHEGLATAGELGCGFVHPHRRLCTGTDLVARAHDRGLGVNAWTATTADEVRRLRAAGVDGIIADRLDIFQT